MSSLFRDTLYPYNAKYLIEGYNYGNNFSEQKIYKGVKENFGWHCSYRADEKFKLQEEKMFLQLLYMKVICILR